MAAVAVVVVVAAVAAAVAVAAAAAAAAVSWAGLQARARCWLSRRPSPRAACRGRPIGSLRRMLPGRGAWPITRA